MISHIIIDDRLGFFCGEKHVKNYPIVIRVAFLFVFSILEDIVHFYFKNALTSKLVKCQSWKSVYL